MYAKFLIRNQVDLNENDRSCSVFAANLLSYISRLCMVFARNLLLDYINKLCSIFISNLLTKHAGFINKSIAKCGHRWLCFCNQNLIEFIVNLCAIANILLSGMLINNIYFNNKTELIKQ